MYFPHFLVFLPFWWLLYQLKCINWQKLIISSFTALEFVPHLDHSAHWLVTLDDRHSYQNVRNHVQFFWSERNTWSQRFARWKKKEIVLLGYPIVELCRKKCWMKNLTCSKKFQNCFAYQLWFFAGRFFGLLRQITKKLIMQCHFCVKMDDSQFYWQFYWQLKVAWLFLWLSYQSWWIEAYCWN